MSESAKNASRPRPVHRSDPGIADLARGANGLGEPADPQEIAQSLVTAQLRAMTTMMAASVDMTTAGFKAMTQVWTMGLPKRRHDRDGER